MERVTLPIQSDLMQPFEAVSPPNEPPPMVDFRGHNGNSFALPYGQLMAMAFHPTTGVRLEFREHKIVIRGRNLRPLYDHFLQHRVSFVLEEDFDASPESATFVDSISVERIIDAD